MGELTAGCFPLTLAQVGRRSITAMSTTSGEYDVIFAGGDLPAVAYYCFRPELTISLRTGGSTACLVAGRLADADPSLRILIIEAGPHTRNDLAHIQPARYLTHLQPNSTTVTFHSGNPEKALGGRRAIVPCGHCVGGGSSVNCT